MGIALFLGFFILLLLGVPIAIAIAVPSFLVIWGGGARDASYRTEFFCRDCKISTFGYSAVYSSRVHS